MFRNTYGYSYMPMNIDDDSTEKYRKFIASKKACRKPKNKKRKRGAR